MHEKMFYIFSHHRNANQKYIEISSPPSQNSYPQEVKEQQILARMCGGGKEPLCTIGGNVN
jgi:hypothetical protein